MSAAVGGVTLSQAEASGSLRKRKTTQEEVTSVIQHLDVFPKTLDEFSERTSFGGVATLLSTIIIIYLFLSELIIYWTPDRIEHLHVDKTFGEKLRINLDVTFHSIPCPSLHLDAMDASGEQQIDIDHHVYKIRLDQHGNPVGQAAKHKDIGVTTDEECGDCHGAGLEGECCNTCDDVKKAFKRKGRSESAAEVTEQCIHELMVEAGLEDSNEGCNIKGWLEVQKVAGNFHFAPGRSFSDDGRHIHTLNPMEVMKFNVTHTVNKLSFGDDFPGVVNPLDGVAKVIPEEYITGVFQYFIKVVRTEYKRLDGTSTVSNQFSVTEHFRGSGGLFQGFILPGIFFVYDVSPIMVRFEETYKSLTHFLTSLCAIIGGIFTVSGMMDKVIHSAVSSMSGRSNYLPAKSTE